MLRLGELEAAVMDVLWSSTAPLRVRDVMGQLDPARTHAYTTVMTVMDNLHTKGLVERSREGRAYAYRAAKSRPELGAELLRQVLGTTGDPENVLLHFAQSADAEESRFLSRAVSRAARAKKRTTPKVEDMTTGDGGAV